MGTKDLWSLPLKDGIPTGKPEIVKSDMGERFDFLGVTDDKSLYFATYNSRSDIYMAELNFASGQIISPPSRLSNPDKTRYFRPSWSPDGRYVAYLIWPARTYYLGDRYIFIIHDTNTGSDRRVLTDLYGNKHGLEKRPVWSNDGKNLLVQARTKDHIQGFYLVNVESGKETPVLVTKRESPFRGESIGMFPSFTRDGKGIYYLSADQKTIIKRNISTKQETTLHSDEDEIFQFKVSPDESQIVFAYWFVRKSALFSMPASGGEITKLVQLQEKVRPYMVSWTPDNKQVIFLARPYGKFDAQMTKIMQVPVGGGEPEQVMEFKELFDHGLIESFEIHPDANKVVFGIKDLTYNKIWALENLFEK
jgi:Tol biopolymer transport system component